MLSSLVGVSIHTLVLLLGVVVYYHRTVENQVFSLHCSENAFVEIFDNSYNILTNIFNDAMWGEQDYGNSQLSWVKLVDEMNCNSRTELYIEWTMKGFYDMS
ncbi:4080_t:CDS:2, partial [Scutellospora calospora]